MVANRESRSTSSDGTMTDPTTLIPTSKLAAHAKELISDSDSTVLIEFFAEYHKARQNKICDFCFGSPQEMASPELVRIFQNGLTPTRPDYYRYRTNYDGPREFLAASAAKRYAFEQLDPEDVFFTTGNFAGIPIALQLVVELGDNVIYMEPGWFCYRRMILNARGIPRPVKMPLDVVQDDDMGDMNAVLDAIDDNTKVVILNQPHNPTGKVYSGAWLKQFSERLLKISRTRGYPVYVLADEAYSDYVFDGAKHEAIAAIYPYTFLAYTYNKLTLAPSQRVGYFILSPLMPGREIFREAVLELQITLTWCFPNATMMESIPKLESFRDNFDITIMSRKRDLMCGILEKIGYKLLVKPKGTFYILVKTPIQDDAEFCKHLARRNAWVLPGHLLNTPGCFRICLTATEDMIERSADAFRETFETLG